MFREYIGKLAFYIFIFIEQISLFKNLGRRNESLCAAIKNWFWFVGFIEWNKGIVFATIHFRPSVVLTLNEAATRHAISNLQPLNDIFDDREYCSVSMSLFFFSNSFHDEFCKETTLLPPRLFSKNAIFYV